MSSKKKAKVIEKTASDLNRATAEKRLADEISRQARRLNCESQVSLAINKTRDRAVRIVSSLRELKKKGQLEYDSAFEMLCQQLHSTVVREVCRRAMISLMLTSDERNRLDSINETNIPLAQNLWGMTFDVVGNRLYIDRAEKIMAKRFVMDELGPTIFVPATETANDVRRLITRRIARNGIEYESHRLSYCLSGLTVRQEIEDECADENDLYGISEDGCRAFLEECQRSQP